MNVVGLITEYNPFHKGHEYHITKAKELTGANHAVVIMSGNYVQRGTPAFMNKHDRTEIALKHGADLVLELPLPFSCSSAEYFALAAVSVLHKTGIVDSICFGAETDDLDLLKKIAYILTDAKNTSTHPINNFIKKYIKNGASYASARAMALCEFIDNEDIKSIIEQPNNILAIEYLKALTMLNSHIKPFLLKRTISSYHDISTNDYMYSASSLRKGFNEEQYLETIFSFDDIYKKNYNFSYPIAENDFDYIVAAKLTEKIHSDTNLTIYNNIDEQLANRIINNYKEYGYKGFNEFCMTLKSKNLAYTSICRGLLAILLDIKKSDMNEYLNNNICNFVKILGFNKSASKLLNQIKNKSNLTIIGQLSEMQNDDTLNGIDRMMLNKSIYADELYNSVVRLKYSNDIPNEYRRKLIVK